MHPNIQNTLLVWGSRWEAWSLLYTLCLDFILYEADAEIKVFILPFFWAPAGRESPPSSYISVSGYSWGRGGCVWVTQPGLSLPWAHRAATKVPTLRRINIF